MVERITYHNEENGYTVAKLLPERRPHFLNAWEQEVAIVGNMVGINVGESVELTGRWVIHGEYGKQFAVDRMRTVLPATAAGQRLAPGEVTRRLSSTTSTSDSSAMRAAPRAVCAVSWRLSSGSSPSVSRIASISAPRSHRPVTTGCHRARAALSFW